MTDALLDLFPYVVLFSDQFALVSTVVDTLTLRAARPACTTSASSGRRCRCSPSSVRPCLSRSLPSSPAQIGPRSVDFCEKSSRARRNLDYSKLPPSPTVDEVFLLDPLIATGGTACAAMNMIVEWGVPGTCASKPAGIPYGCHEPFRMAVANRLLRSKQDQASRRTRVTRRPKACAGRVSRR